MFLLFLALWFLPCLLPTTVIFFNVLVQFWHDLGVGPSMTVWMVNVHLSKPDSFVRQFSMICLDSVRFRTTGEKRRHPLLMHHERGLPPPVIPVTTGQMSTNKKSETNLASGGVFLECNQLELDTQGLLCFTWWSVYHNADYSSHGSESDPWPFSTISLSFLCITFTAQDEQMAKYNYVKKVGHRLVVQIISLVCSKNITPDVLVFVFSKLQPGLHVSVWHALSHQR